MLGPYQAERCQSQLDHLSQQLGQICGSSCPRIDLFGHQETDREQHHRETVQPTHRFGIKKLLKHLNC